MKYHLLTKNTCIIVIIAGLSCFVLSPQARAVCQEGCNTTYYNTYLGFNALINNTPGSFNTASGDAALLLNTTGFANTATGAVALYSNTDGYDNTASGASALYSNTDGHDNTAMGEVALYSNTTGSYNTAIGRNALLYNTSGNSNTANGESALGFNSTGGDNTAIGRNALYVNNGDDNTATGSSALASNTTGYFNTAAGVDALAFNRTGAQNTASGGYALENNTIGSSNIAVGFNAGLNLTTGSNNIDIGNKGVAAESRKIRIGTRGTHTATFIAGINGVTVAGGINVLVNTNGQLGTTTSSARYKEAIQPMDKASEAILSLKPVTFRYKHELDPAGIPQFGLVAEQVEKINPDLVVRGDDGKPYSVRYDAVNAMLLNEFLKEHKKVEEQQTTIAQLKSTTAQERRDLEGIAARQEKEIQALTAQLKEHSAQIQRVSAQVELNKSVPQIVQNR